MLSLSNYYDIVVCYLPPHIYLIRLHASMLAVGPTFCDVVPVYYVWVDVSQRR